MTALPPVPLNKEEQEAWNQQQLGRIGPLKQVTQEQLATIRDLQEKLKVAEAAARRTKDVERQRDGYKYELDMYRTIVKGFPKGRKLIKQLTRDPYDY